MKKSAFGFVLGSALTMLVSECSAVEMTLGPVAVTFAITKKQSEGTVYPRDESGREDKTQPRTHQVNYTVTAANGSRKEYGQFGKKSTVVKLGNKELLTYLSDEGHLDGSIAGWSFMAQPEFNPESGGMVYQVYAYKASTKERYDWFTISASSEMTGAASSVVSVDAAENIISKTISGSVTYEQAVAINADENQNVLGLFTCSATVKTYLADPTDKTSVEFLVVPAAAKVANVVGNDEDDNPYSGTISFAASKMVIVP